MDGRGRGVYPRGEADSVGVAIVEGLVFAGIYFLIFYDGSGKYM